MGWFYGELPTKAVRLPERVHEKRKAPTWEQVCSLANALPEPCSTLVLFLSLSGLRIGEAMGLRWKHVNLTAEPVLMDNELLAPYSLAVRENYVMGKYSTLKTKGSVRNVPIPEWFVPRLNALISRASSSEGSSRISGLPEEPVFANGSGTVPIDQHNLAARVLKPAATKLGMEWISWHCLRHANATMADQAGISVVERQMILGHATTDIALRYTHAEMERIRKRVESMVDPKAIERKSADFGHPLVAELPVSSDFVM